MQPEIRHDRSVITVNQDERVNIQVVWRAPDAPPLTRSPIDVIFVIDRSGSMTGDPITSVCDAVAEVLRNLGPDDRAGVVVFGSDAEMVLPLERHVGEHAGRVVRSIRTTGSTNLSAGWLLAASMLREIRREGAVRRIVVLTDGHVNQGIVEEDRLSDLVASGRRDGVSTSLIGFGRAYQEELLGALANAGGGNDYWCEGSDAAARVFRGEFDGLASVVAQNVAVKVVPTDAVAAAGVLNDFAVTQLADGAFRVDLGDAFGGEERSVVIGLNTRPQPVGGPVEVATVELSWVSTADGFAEHSVTIPITVTAGENGIVDSAADPRVTEEVIVLEAARDRREARRRADTGDYEGAQQIAERVVDRLREVPSQSDAYFQAVAEHDAIRSRSWDASHSKQAYSSSREMSRKRMSQYRSDQPPSEPRRSASGRLIPRPPAGRPSDPGEPGSDEPGTGEPGSGEPGSGQEQA